MYPINIEFFSGTTLAVLPHQGCYQEIGPVFERAMALATERGLAGKNALGYGVYFDDPEEVPVAELRAVVGMSVAPGADLGDALQRFEIPAGQYAILDYSGPADEVINAYQWLFAEWLPASGREPADFPLFEQYLHDAGTPPELLSARIFMQLK
ncbi:GyrI-like domain-containing protein [Achromobacter sp. UMC71]|uniref:AraC family transcriptional regulator n=1 Tax=Achromobacter sp. UMC71 TaxID=1862320 RepID=UPI001603D09F|nr:GyrI-like domain-containing protein [Achromobacter sp. UMC71]MBB1626202.1 hypothetical protein [Achromobacter sp. UMC71]